ncbi:hypothetical protein GCM10010913_03780 [Paenibacillus aceti]|uniref:Uncharacterized protein n=1 Tax=Paenibacillus aceti TaxID=1820010 RepID=A0ABQ1VPZ4_9BACL|nr:hypothetical protein GCM10010913_03780 [Paenibacillus aceti]
MLVSESITKSTCTSAEYGTISKLWSLQNTSASSLISMTNLQFIGLYLFF